MPYSTYLKNLWLDVLRGVSADINNVYVSAHSGDPGDSGDNELSGGTPAYARQLVTWNAAAAGVLDSSNIPVLDIPPGTTVTHLGLWDAATGGNFLGGRDVVDESYASQGTYTVSDVDLDLNL